MDTSKNLNFFTAKKSIDKGRKHFHMMIKPIGAVCNLNCTYCYYLEKMNIYKDKTDMPNKFRMSDSILEEYTKVYIKSQPIENPRVVFAWQGGEATMLGIDFFRKAIKFQNKYSDGRRIENTLQTNGMLIDEEWGKFLSENNFLVGISIDGPKNIHNYYRKNIGGKGSYDRVMQSIYILNKYKVQFNTMSVVSNITAKDPVKVYRFLKSLGTTWLQFSPIQERRATDDNVDLKLVANDYEGEAKVTKESVRPKEWGNFLIKIFDEWVRNDVGKIFIKEFDAALEAWCGFMPSSCIHSKYCGDGLIIEHNGDVYSCDHHVYPQYKLGNILETDLLDMANSDKQKEFGHNKYDTLSKKCLSCDYLTACYGECPKHRFNKTKEGEDQAYLCEGYYAFYEHIAPYMHVMRTLKKIGKAPAEIMDLIKLQEKEEQKKK